MSGMAGLYCMSILQETAEPFSKVVLPFYIPTRNMFQGLNLMSLIVYLNFMIFLFCQYKCDSQTEWFFRRETVLSANFCDAVRINNITLTVKKLILLVNVQGRVLTGFQRIWLKIDYENYTDLGSLLLRDRTSMRNYSLRNGHRTIATQDDQWL